ncbi:ClpX C4-type zinc finger protein [Usitatibacter rugosus]|uniref:ClpX C4-type zinc finger protein n=1 Tax=Usitatibacter rugosus TaxID=2732067 RepID=UPI0014897973
MNHQCSFCGLGEAPQRRLIAGPGAFICSDCVRLATETFAAADLLPAVQCAICGEPDSPENHLIFEGKGQLCASCVRAVRAATDAVAK